MISLQILRGQGKKYWSKERSFKTFRYFQKLYNWLNYFSIYFKTI